MANYTPTIANTQDDDHIILCKILDSVGLGNQSLTAGGNAFDVNVVPSLGNGLPSAYSVTSSGTSANNLLQIKATATLLGTCLVNNTTGTDYFVSFIDNASASASTTPKFVIRARANSVISFPMIPSGVNFSNGLAVAFTTTFGGTTLMGATGVDITLTYL